MKWYAIVFTAIVLEGIVEYVKLAVNKNMCVEIIATIVAGVGAALAFNLDMFALAGIPAQMPYVGSVLTGILIARGSNYIFDLIGRLTESKTKLAASLAQADDETSVDDHEDGGEG